MKHRWHDIALALLCGLLARYEGHRFIVSNELRRTGPPELFEGLGFDADGSLGEPPVCTLPAWPERVRDHAVP